MDKVHIGEDVQPELVFILSFSEREIAETVQVRYQGAGRWAVVRGERYDLNVGTGEFEWAPSPGNREDGWLADHRYDSFTSAVSAAYMAVEKLKEHLARCYPKFSQPPAKEVVV